VQPGVAVKLVQHPDFGEEKFVVCRSEQREEKERAILQKQAERLEAKLEQIRCSILKGRLKSPSVAERRVGRWMGRYSRAEHLFEVKLQNKADRLSGITVKRSKRYEQWAQLSHGAYLLRTNLTEEDPCKLWKTYIQLNQAEQAFRIGKSDLGIRPVYHQKQERVQAHIFICFLALAMWKSLELWMKAKGLGSCARRLLEEVKEIRSLDVLLPIRDRNPVRLRLVTRPEPHVQVLLARLGLQLPNRAKTSEM